MATVRMPDGRLYDTTGYSQEDIDKARGIILERMTGQYGIEEEQGFFGRTGDLLELGGRELLSSGSEGIATLSDMAFGDSTDSFEQGLQSFAQGQRDAASEIEGIKPIQEAEGIGDVLTSAGSYLVQSIPEMATVFAGAAAGQLLIPIPIVGALVGGTLAGIIPFLGRNTQEFKEVNGRAPTAEEGVALLGTATVQSGLNTLITRLVPFKGSTRITPNMIKKGLAGTGLEGSTELSQDLLQVLAANNFDTSVLQDPDVQYRLTESFLAGAATGGGIGVTTAPFTTETPPSPIDPELATAAQDFVTGRPRQIEGREAVPQIGFDGGVETPETTVGEVTSRDGTRRPAILTGNQQSALESRPETENPQYDAMRSTLDEAMKRAQAEGRDPREVFNDPEVAKQLEDAVTGASTTPINIGPSAASRAQQETSQLTGEQILEFARNNRSDQVIADTLKAGIPLKRKIELLTRRFAELNISPSTAQEAGETGSPILRPTAEMAQDPEGFADRGVEAGTVEATDIAGQPRMEYDGEMGPQPLDDEGVQRTVSREAVEPDDNEGLLRTLRAMGTEESQRTAEDGSVDQAATDQNLNRYSGAVNYLNARLKELSNRGTQGKKVADSIRGQVMNDQSMGANEIVGAFMAADAIVDTLGGAGVDGGVDINFLKSLQNKKGHALNGLKSYKPTTDGKLQAVIDLAFYNDSPTRVAQTAQHEAFHVLQDFYEQHSPSDAKLLSSVYKLKDGKVNYKALPSSVRKLWKKYAPQEHKMALDGTLPVMESPSEFQAMTYEFYQRARQAGDENPLSGAFGKYFDFVSRFLPRLANSLRGMGFQTAEDVFTRAAKGKTARKISGREVTPRSETIASEESRVVPVRRDNAGMQGRFGVANPAEGGNYVQLDENFNAVADITGQTFTGATIIIDEKGRPDMQVSDVETALTPSTNTTGQVGRVVNLVNPSKSTKKRAKWEWLDRDNETDPIHTIVSVTSTNNLSSENGGATKIKNPSGDHLYALAVNMDGPAKLATFPDSPSEPRLRPVMYAEQMVKGPVIGRIRMKGRDGGKEHPVYEYINLRKEDQVDKAASSVGSEESLRAIFDNYQQVLDSTDIQPSGFTKIYSYQEFKYEAVSPPVYDFYRLNDAQSVADAVVDIFQNKPDSSEAKLLRSYMPADFFKFLKEGEIGQAKDEVMFFNDIISFGDAEANIATMHVIRSANLAYDAANNALRKVDTRGYLPSSDNIPFILMVKTTDGDISFEKFEHQHYDLNNGMPYMADAIKAAKPILKKITPDSPKRFSRDLTVIMDNQQFYIEDLPDSVRGLDQYKDKAGDSVNFMNVDFKVDDRFDAMTGDVPITPQALFEMFGRVVASVRKGLDYARDNGIRVDGVKFAGNSEQKQRIYNKLANSERFKQEFPELGDAVKYYDSSFVVKKPEKTEPVQMDMFNEASIRLDRVQDLNDVAPMNRNNNAIADQFGFDEGMRKRSSMDVLYNPNFDPQLPDADNAKGKDGKKRTAGRNVSEAGRMLHNRSLSVLEEPLNYTNRTPESDEKLSRILAAETVAARQNNPENNATNWYTANIQAAIDSVAEMYPEVATDREHRSAFSLALAITSQGIVVSRNSRLGLAAYEFWRDNGRFPVFGEGKSSPAIEKNFINANILLDVFKEKNESFYQFLDTQFTVGELKQALQDIGIKVGKGGVTLSGEQVNTNVYGSFMFGPKIGQGFYQNLMGNYDPITIDLWFMRTWGRLTGTLVGNKKAFENNLQEMRVEMRNEGVQFDEDLFGTDEQYTFDLITEQNEIGEAYYDSQRDAGVPKAEIKKTQLMRSAANALTNGVKPKDTPSGGQQRSFIRDIVSRAREILAENGLNLTSADMQAILWYPEKDLYAKLTNGGLEERLNESYEDAFKEIMNGKTGLRSVDGTARPDSVRATIDKADAESSGKAGRTIQGEEESVRFGAGDYRTTDGMRAIMADPNARSVSAKVYNFIRKFTTKEGRAASREKFVNEFIHGLAPIARRELELNYRRTGERRYLPFAQGAFKITEIAQQLSGKMEMFTKLGAPKLNADGTVSIVEGTRGLRDIFEPIGTGDKYAKFQMYVYAQRAQRLKAEGRENLLTDEQIAEGMRYGAENPEFNEVFNQYKNFNESLMQFLQDTGAIDQETKQKLIGTADYVPFYRVIEEEHYTEGFMGQVRRASTYAQNTTSAFDNPDARIKDVLRKLKGGEEKIGDLYENVFQNTQAIVSAGLRNLATQRTVGVIEELKATGFYDGVQAPRRISSTEAQNNNNHFTLRENGKTVFYDVGSDGELITAMRTFTPMQMNGFLRTMQQIGRFFRNMITITPSFMEANLIRGDMAGVVTVDAPLRPMVDTMIGLKNALADAETVQEMKTIGGFGGYTFGESNTEFAKKMKRFYRRHEGYTIVDTPQKLSDMFMGLVDKVNTVGEATEMATREAIFRRMLEQGAEKGDAAYEALNLINYSRKGNPQGGAAQTFAMLLPLVPFLNARVQGLYRTGTAFGTEANAKRTAMKGLTLMGLSMGLYAIMSQEDDWEQEPLYRKLNYYIIYAGDKKFLIPKPFEIGAVFSTIPEVFLDGIRQRDGEYVAEAVSQIFLNNFSFNPIPQAVRPIVEVATNQDFFRGRELESLGVRGLPTAMRSYSTTSEFAKLMGDATALAGISPIEFEQLVNGYLGSLGGLFLGGMDSILGTFGTIPSKPAGLFGSGLSDVAARNLGLTRFVKERGNDPANRFLSEFYELKREADEINRGINRLREEGNYEEAMEMRRDNRSLLGVRKQLNKKYQQLNELNDRIQGIKTSGMSPEAKKSRIDQLIRQRNRLVSDMARLKKRIRDD